MRGSKLAIFDFDGTLFDTRKSIARCINLTFEALAPLHVPDQLAIDTVLATGAGLQETFEKLHAITQLSREDGGPSNSVVSSSVKSPAIQDWITTYRSIYNSCLSLITPYPDAERVLRNLKADGCLVVIVSNKGQEAVTTVLKIAKMDDIPDLVLGETPGLRLKPDPMAYFDIILPRLRLGNTQPDGDQLAYAIPDKVCVIGDTSADLKFAKNIGAVECWAKYGYGRSEECVAMKPRITISCLGDLLQSLKEILQ